VTALDQGGRLRAASVSPRYSEGVPTGRDDDALSWGEDDPTLDVGSRADQPAADITQDDSDFRSDTAVLPEGYTAVGRGSETVAAADGSAAEPKSHSADPTDHDHDQTPPLGNAALIALGVLGGFSVLFAVGWLIGGLRLQGTAEFLVAPLAYQISLWLAVIAPIVWFATVLVLTRGRRLWVRFAWLVGGIVLLVPWPFIMVGVIGR
jgi:hypothetical protein